jgi:hypothetical protein
MVKISACNTCTCVYRRLWLCLQLYSYNRPFWGEIMVNLSINKDHILLPSNGELKMAYQKVCKAVFVYIS